MLELWFVVGEMVTIGHKFKLDSVWRGLLGQESNKLKVMNGFQWERDPQGIYFQKWPVASRASILGIQMLINKSLGFQNEGAYSFFKNESDLQNKHSKRETSKINNKHEKQNKKLCHRIWFSSIKKKMKLCFCAVQKQKSWWFSASSSLNKKERSCFQLTLCSWRNVLGRKMFEEIAHFKQILWNIYKKLILSSQSCVLALKLDSRNYGPPITEDFISSSDLGYLQQRAALGKN